MAAQNVGAATMSILVVAPILFIGMWLLSAVISQVSLPAVSGSAVNNSINLEAINFTVNNTYYNFANSNVTGSALYYFNNATFPIPSARFNFTSSQIRIFANASATNGTTNNTITNEDLGDFSDWAAPNFNNRTRITVVNSNMSGYVASGANMTNYTVRLNFTFPSTENYAGITPRDFNATNQTDYDKLSYHRLTQGTGWVLIDVLVPYVAANSNETLFIYHNNNTAVDDESSVEGSYIFADAFTSALGGPGGLDSSKWSTVTAPYAYCNINTTGGFLQENNTGGANKCLINATYASLINTGTDYTIYTSSSMSASDAQGGSNQVETLWRWNNANFSTISAYSFYYLGQQFNDLMEKYTGGTSADLNTTVHTSDSSFHDWRITVLGHQFNVTKDYTKDWSKGFDLDYYNTGIGLYLISYDTTKPSPRVDWFGISPLNSVEPTTIQGANEPKETHTYTASGCEQKTTLFNPLINSSQTLNYIDTSNGNALLANLTSPANYTLNSSAGVFTFCNIKPRDYNFHARANYTYTTVNASANPNNGYANVTAGSIYYATYNYDTVTTSAASSAANATFTNAQNITWNAITLLGAVFIVLAATAISGFFGFARK